MPVNKLTPPELMFTPSSGEVFPLYTLEIISLCCNALGFATPIMVNPVPTLFEPFVSGAYVVCEPEDA